MWDGMCTTVTLRIKKSKKEIKKVKKTVTLRIKKIQIATKSSSLVFRTGDIVTFDLKLWSSEVTSFTEQPRIVVGKADSSFHVEFLVDHPHLVLHLSHQ